jgi:hypothetical protein
MPLDDQRPKNQSTPQSIPLQNLSRPPDLSRGDGEWSRARSDSGGRAGTFLGSRNRLSGRRSNGRYERVLAGPSGANGDTDDELAPPHITTPRITHQPAPAFDDGELSPVNVGDFQAAMGSVGLVFDNTPSRPSPLPHSTSPSGSYLGPIMEDSTTPPTTHATNDTNEAEDYFPGSQAIDDRSPLTDSRYLQPISGSQLPPAPGQRHERVARHSRNAYSTGMLGDDLSTAENGLRSSSRRSVNRLSSLSIPNVSRSLSTSASPLNSAGSMLRKMSQRVVNISNDDVVEQSLRRQESVRMATLDAPPSFPAMTEYAHDEPLQPGSPLEKTSAEADMARPKNRWQSKRNPLAGKSLGIFAPNNRLRRGLCEVLVHPLTEPLILVLILLQTILLAVQAAPTLTREDTPDQKGRQEKLSSPYNIAFFAMFVIYTVELLARVIVSGFVFNAQEYRSAPAGVGFVKSARNNLRSLFGTQRRRNDTKGPATQPMVDPQVSIIRSFTSLPNQQEHMGHGRQAQRVRLARRAFLRHSFNRLDFLAVGSFWIAFVLRWYGVDHAQHIFVFQMLSCLRILRLLSLSSGTSVILRSLKKAAPLLVNVAFLIGFFWLLFAIIGVQTFKSSLRRSCLFLGTENATALLDVVDYNRTNFYNDKFAQYAYNQNDGAGNVQFCGGHTNPLTGEEQAFLRPGFLTQPDAHAKGYWCPVGSLCIENGGAIYANTVSFDNIFSSLEMVFVIMSTNTWSSLLYWTTDSDSMTSAFYFVLAVIIMGFWLINLLVAVITSSFQVLREESKTSAFTMDDQPLVVEEDEKPRKKSTPLKKLYDKTYWFWIIIIILSLLIQALPTATSSQDELSLLSSLEAVITLVLLLEMVLRFASDWRGFRKSTRNWVDLALAIITTVMQIPAIKNSGRPYDWMTIFQILRIYRVVLAIPMVRDLVVVVLGNVSGILNLIIFVLLVTFLAAIFAVQLLRGELPTQDTNGNDIRITFGDIWNSFLGMYQVLSSENWTDILFTSTEFENQYNTAWVSALFFILWFIFANFIILNMFIAVIQENFDVSEDEKRLHQVKAFLQQKELTGSTHSNLSISAIFRLGRDKNRKKDPVDYGPATIEMFKDTVVRDFLDEQMEAMEEDLGEGEDGGNGMARGDSVQSGFLIKIWSRAKRLIHREPNPFYSELMFSRPYEELDPRNMAKEIATAAEQRKQAQRKYLLDHPRYNVSLFIFPPHNPVRRLCQQIVGPGRGSKRIEGVEPVRSLWYTFSFLIYACIVAMVLLACIATPLYQSAYFDKIGGFHVRNWFVWTDMAFAAVFSIEAIVKVIADGFFWTPNAYFRGTWGLIDGIVLFTLWLSVGAALFDIRSLARGVGAFKSLRALRLLNVSDTARNTFHSVIILGGWKVLSAAFVSISLLIPFAIYGLNLFKDRLMECNDNSIDTLKYCVGEYASNPFNWNVLAPRVRSNSYYNFDNFSDSLFILFQIVSQEGWTDVMWRAIAARGPGLQPVPNASRGNSIFFLAFNLLGAVFVLTLFVSVFMRNYTEQTGVAFLTAEQRSWLELRKLLRQISPSKRPTNQSNLSKWKNKCYRIAISKHGRWSRTITGILILHLVLLIVEFYPDVEAWELLRSALFALFVILYIINIVIRIAGLTWERFRRSSWDLFSLISVGGTVVLTPISFAIPNNVTVSQLQRLFLVSIALLLIPRNNQLDQLFKTAAASFNAIANLLVTWFVLFLVWAIALTQTLGLTKFGAQGLPNMNFRTVPKALILLFRTSIGEGWNQIMEDYASAVPPNCIAVPDNFYKSDCGSAPWARFLFVSWNIISMYIFVSMFVSLIFESFSYVYQRSSGLSSLSREEIRRFKQAWAEFDPDGTGYITKEAFPKLLGELSGVFEMRIYDGEFTVGAILEDCKVEPRAGEPQPGVVHGIDLHRLNQRLNKINVPEIRRRRDRLNIFSQEVLVSADPDRGISFSSCLLILAHYNVINDSKSLRLEEFLRRRYRLQRVEEEVHRRVVIGFFDTLFWSRQFARRKVTRHSARMVDVPQFAVPEIFVDDPDGATPRVDTFPRDVRDPQSPVASPDQRSPSGTSGLVPDQPPPSTPVTTEGLRSRGSSFGSSPTRSDRSYEPSPRLTPTTRPRGASDVSVIDPFSYGDGSSSPIERRGSEGSQGGSTGLQVRNAQGTRHRRQQSSVNSQRAMTPMEAFDSSAWGESIRKSFTVRRSNTRGRGRQTSRPPMPDPAE